MFFLFALCSVFGYSLQTVLIAPYARRLDPLSVGAYRGLGLAISMSPLLLVTTPSAVQSLGEHADSILLASFFGALGVWNASLAVRYFAVGICAAINHTTKISMYVVLGFFLFHERLEGVTLLCIAYLAIANLSLIDHRGGVQLTEGTGRWHGLVFASLAGVFQAFGFTFMVDASRQVDPFIVGYVWEVLIGLALIGFSGTRKLFGGNGLSRITRADFVQILLRSSPTLIGTTCFALASLHGPIAILGAIASSSIVVTVVLSSFINHEWLDRRQWRLVLLVFGGVVALRLIT